MANSKTLLFISTHIINKAIISEYSKLSSSHGYDCILAIDNTNLKLSFKSRICKKIFFNKEVNCLIFDKDLHKELNLPNSTFNVINSKFTKIMWYNADYRYYYVKKFFPNYEYYWQFDYDVFCNGRSYMPFLQKFANSKKDLLITHFHATKKNSEWCWTNGIDWIYDDKIGLFSSFFPVCRLSNAAIDFLYKKRIEQGEIFKKLKKIKNQKWLNCEIFVPTELMNNNFSCENIEEKNIHLNEFDLNENRIFEFPDNLLYHPVKGYFSKRICINLLSFKIKLKPNRIINIC